MTSVTISAIKEEILKQNTDLTEKQVEFMPISIRLFGATKEVPEGEEGTTTETTNIGISSENGIIMIQLS